MATVKNRGLAAIFKRKEGGTALGNTLRGILNKATGGVLGNGLLMKKSGTTQQQTVDDLKSIAAAAADAAILKSASITQPETKVEQNNPTTMKEKLLNLWATKKSWVIAGIVVVAGLIVFIVKRHKSAGRKSRR